MAKNPGKNRDYPWIHRIWIRRLCADNSHSIAHQLYCSITQAWHQREGKKVGLLYSPPPPTGDATSSLEPKKAWVPLLDWGGFQIAWQGALHWALLKRLLSAFFWLRPDSPAGSRPPGTVGQYCEPCTCPRAGFQFKPPSQQCHHSFFWIWKIPCMKLWGFVAEIKLKVLG